MVGIMVWFNVSVVTLLQNQENIQQPTFNIEHPVMTFSQPWMLSVRC